MKQKVPKLQKEIEHEIKQEERIIFHHFIYLKKHHQVIFALIIFVCVIFIWRGVWDLIHTYWFPKNLLFSDVTGIIFALFVLYLSHQLMKQLGSGI